MCVRQNLMDFQCLYGSMYYQLYTIHTCIIDWLCMDDFLIIKADTIMWYLFNYIFTQIIFLKAHCVSWSFEHIGIMFLRQHLRYYLCLQVYYLFLMFNFYHYKLEIYIRIFVDRFIQSMSFHSKNHSDFREISFPEK